MFVFDAFGDSAVRPRAATSVYSPLSPADPRMAYSSCSPYGLDDERSPLYTWNTAPYSPVFDDPLASQHIDEAGALHSLIAPSASDAPPTSAHGEQYDQPDTAYSSSTDSASPFNFVSPVTTNPSGPAPSSEALSSCPVPPQAPIPAVPATHTKRRRARVQALTLEQREKRARRLHRVIDSRRRHKELAGYSALRKLVAQRPSHTDRSEEEPAGETLSKAAVLDTSAAMIRQLQQLCAYMQQACNAKDERIQQLTHDVQGALYARPHDCAAVTCRVQQLQRSGCLAQSSYLSSALCVLVFDMPLSLLIDCNEASLQCLGWSRGQLLHSVMKSPHSMPLKSEDERRELAGHRVCPLVLSAQRAQKRRQLVNGECSTAGEGGEERYVAQYASSIEAVRALAEGSKQQTSCVWRVRAASGELYEVQMSMWREGSSKPEECETARQPPQPPGQRWANFRMMGSYSSYDRVRVDDDCDELG